MLNWLKFTFGSFTSNKISKEGATRSFWNVVFALFLSLVILTALYSAGINYSFTNHYSKAEAFKEYTYSIFANENKDERINLQVNKVENADSKLEAFYGLDKKNVAIINSFENAFDQKYAKDGFNIIIDTRPADSTFVEFEIKYYLKSDHSQFISYEEYKKLDNKNDYVGELKASNNTKVLTLEEIEGYRKYIEEEFISDAREEVKKEWDEIKKLDNTSKDYMNKTYDFYTRYYYNLTLCPNNVFYYQSEYAKFDDEGNYVHKNFILLTESWGMVSFKNDKGTEIAYDGYYTNMEDGFSIFNTLTDSNDIQLIKNNVDYFMISLYDSVSSIRSFLIGLQLFRFIPIFIIALAVLGLFLFCLGKIKKNDYASRYVGSFKIVSSYLIGAATISGILTLIIAFFVNSQTAVNVGMWSLLSALSVRVFIFAIVEAIRNRKNKDFVTAQPVIDKENIVEEEHHSIDLSKVETGTKIIENDEVDDDEDEKMELM